MRAIPKTPSLNLRDAKRLLKETQALRKAAVKRNSYIAAVQLLGKETDLLAEIELHRLKSLEADELTEEKARKIFLDALPSVPLPLLEAALREYAQRVGLSGDRLRTLIAEAASTPDL
jgi:hypothetical protein